jgi:hypothetical protein
MGTMHQSLSIDENLLGVKASHLSYALLDDSALIPHHEGEV